MERDTRRVVGFVTSQFVFIAALVHLSLGVVNWLRWLQAGVLVVGRGAGVPETLSVQWFLDHLFAGPVEFVSVVVETLGAAGLAVLFVTSEDRVTAGDDPG